MKNDQLTALVAAIKHCELLEPAAMEQLESWANSDGADPQEIAREIVQRKWLTAFQVKAFWKGRGEDLFINQYVLMEKLGAGGMGDVFKARHMRMDRIVAIKLIRPERLANPETVKRFQREIKAASQLQHENVVVAYDADQDGDLNFFVMEYVDGTNFYDLVTKQGPLPVGQACDYIRQAALGLQHAHERGMIHRDIKPANLLLSKKGQVKILDMGLARIDTGPNDDTRMTIEGLTFGTPDFISPEQSRNAREADIRSDIYSLGATFYFLLAGKVMYPGGTPAEKMIAHNAQPAPRVQRLDIPAPVEAVLAKMLAKDPAERYQTPVEVADALKSFSPETNALFSGIFSKSGPPSMAEMSGVLVKGTAIPDPVPKHSDTASRFKFDSPTTVAAIQAPPKTGSTSKVMVVILSSLIVAALAVLVVLLVMPKLGSGTGRNLPARISGSLGMPLVLIPNGKFAMGSPDGEADRQADEGPVREVEIGKPFYMATTEVTQRVYKEIAKDNPSLWKSAREASQMPVEMVSWKEAESFCYQLNQRSDAETGVLSGWTFRLPTEAEWEYACRAGKPTRFHFGDQLTDTQAIFGKQRAPSKAGSLPTNIWGLHDMHGNVWEWTKTFYAPRYDPTILIDPNGPISGSEYVIRGGAFDQPAEDCRSARRLARGINFKDKNLGFRVVLVKE